jgi:hypothetical protein
MIAMPPTKQPKTKRRMQDEATFIFVNGLRNYDPLGRSSRKCETG